MVDEVLDRIIQDFESLGQPYAPSLMEAKQTFFERELKAVGNVIESSLFQPFVKDALVAEIQRYRKRISERWRLRSLESKPCWTCPMWGIPDDVGELIQYLADWQREIVLSRYYA